VDVGQAGNGNYFYIPRQFLAKSKGFQFCNALSRINIMEALGTIISRHRKNASLSWAIIFLGTVFLMPAVLMLVARGNVEPDKRSLIDMTIAGVAGLSAALYALAWWLRRRGLFVLGDAGVGVEEGSQAHAYRFDQIAETCQMYKLNVSVGIAFRTEGGEWKSANAHLAGYRKFRQGFMNGYLKARVPMLIASLKSGKPVSFKVTTEKGKNQKDFSLGIHTYVKADTEIATLTESTLTLRGQAIDLSRVVDCKYLDRSTEIVLTRDDGRKMHLTFTEFFEADLLCALIKQLRAPQQMKSQGFALLGAFQ
jgi:hypothetical protein